MCLLTILNLIMTCFMRFYSAILLISYVSCTDCVLRNLFVLNNYFSRYSFVTQYMNYCHIKSALILNRKFICASSPKGTYRYLASLQ